MTHIRRDTGTTTLASQLHVGVVHGIRSILFVAAAETRTEMLQRIAEFARQQMDAQLYPEDARVMRRLLEWDDMEAAVRFYFRKVGEKWDRQWLDESKVSFGDLPPG